MALTTIGITNLRPKRLTTVSPMAAVSLYFGPSERVQALAVRLPARWQPAHPFNR